MDCRDSLCPVLVGRLWVENCAIGRKRFTGAYGSQPASRMSHLRENRRCLTVHKFQQSSIIFTCRSNPECCKLCANAIALFRSNNGPTASWIMTNNFSTQNVHLFKNQFLKAAFILLALMRTSLFSEIRTRFTMQAEPKFTSVTLHKF